MNELQILEMISGSDFEDRHSTYHNLTYAYMRQLAKISHRLGADNLVNMLAITALLFKKSRRTFAAELDGNALPEFSAKAALR